MLPYRQVGRSGLHLSVLTFGSALTVGTEDTRISYAQSLIDQAWQVGIRSFDTSNNYGLGVAESLVGQALRKYPREEYVLATKGSWPIGPTPYHRGLSRKHILWAFEQSLRRLGAEYVDLYYAHRYDPETPMAEVVRTFNRLLDAGKIRYWATSEWPVEALEECHAVCDRFGLEAPIAEQCIYSYAVSRTDTNGVRAFCESRGIGVLGFSPLAQGLLTGKYRHGIPADSRIAKSAQIGYDKTAKIYEQNRARIDHFTAACERHGVSGAQAALQWVLRRGVLPVVGASHPQQLEESAAAVTVDIPEAFWADLSSVAAVLP